MKMALTPALTKRLEKGGEVSTFDLVEGGQASLDNWVEPSTGFVRKEGRG